MNKPKTTIPAARVLAQQGKLHLALAGFEDHLRDNPSDARVWQHVGDLQLRRADASAALDAYRRSAEAYVTQGFYAKACALYKQILTVAPGSIDAHLRLADLYMEFALGADAQRELEQAARLCSNEPGDPNAMQVRQRLDRMRARSDGEDLSRARKRAQTLLTGGRACEAVSELRPCFEASPDDTDTLELLARALLAARKTERALLVLRRLAFLAHQAGDRARRNEIYERILAVAPGDGEALAATGKFPRHFPEVVVVEEIVAD